MTDAVTAAGPRRSFIRAPHRRRWALERWRARDRGELDRSLLDNWWQWSQRFWSNEFDPTFLCPDCGLDIGSRNITDSMALEIHRDIRECRPRAAEDAAHA